MKKATCKQLAGACDEVITGSTAEDMTKNSKNHAMDMVNAGDEAHRSAMQEMMNMSQEEQQAWYKSFVETFDSLEDA